MGKVLKKIVPIASVAAAPFTGGTSLLGTLGTIGKIVGAVSAASSLFGGDDKPKTTVIRQPAPQQPEKPVVEPAQAPEFVPERPQAIQRPESLNELAAFSPVQERSALATQGLNVGLGSQENEYYKNLLQRSLIGEGNQVSQDNNFLLPIEQQYFGRQGVSTNSPLDFLKGLR